MTTIENAGPLPETGQFLYLREKGPAGDAADPIGKDAEQTDSPRDAAILCRACRFPLTTGQQAISVHDRHLHAFFNPAGVLYEVRCFSKAPGTTTHGAPTEEFSWFQGYRWQYCLCSACLQHIGWLFSSSGDSFYGLIPAKLVEGAGD